MQKLKLSVLAALLAGAIALPARAQQFGFMAGVNVDSALTPHTAGDFSVLIGDGSNYSYTTLKARGPVDRKFTYTLETGYLRKIVDLTSRVSLYADAQAGLATSTAVLSGAFNSNGGLKVKLRPQWSVYVDGGIAVNPADGGIAPRAGIKVLWLPAEK